jgi:hypothetical protein
VVYALGVLPNGDYRIAVLTPTGDCDSDCELRIAESQNVPAAPPATAGATLPAFGRPADWLRNPFGKRVPLPGRPYAPSN